jgi:MFS family permease
VAAAQGRLGVAVTGPAAALALVRKRTFGPYFVGNALSASGTWFQNLAASLLIYRQTHSELLLGVLNFSQFIPILLLAPLAGGASDRWNRRQLLLVTQSVAVVLAGGLGLLAYFDLAPTWVVIADAVALGVVSAFSAPAQQAMIPQLVDEPEVPTAVALNSMTFNLARAIGPASAALAVQYLGIPAAFGLNAFSYLIFIGALLYIGPQAQQLAERGAGHLRASVEILRRQPQLVVFLLIVAAVGFASDPVNTLAPAWANAFGRQDTVAGYIIGVFGAGAVTAGLVVAGRVGGTRRRMFATLLMLSLGMIAFSITPWLPLALPFLFIAGFGYLASNTHATSRLQLGVEPWERGRIMALWSVAFLGLRPFASIVDGAIASAFGVRYAGVLLALPALACAGWIALRARTRGWGAAPAELPPETA